MKKVSEFKDERELQEDLAEYLRASGLLTFTEIKIPNMHNSRADIIAMTPHRYSAKDIRIYEVKLTRGTWLADKKFQKYLECCNRMYIACPRGIIKKEELPAEIGLITRSDNGWRVSKSPRLNINPPKMDVDFILSLIYRGYEENRKQRDLRDRIIAEANVSLKDQSKKIGWEIARRLDKTKESSIEDWCEELWEAFKEFGFDPPEKFIVSDRYTGERVNLPGIYQIRELLGGASALMKDIATIKAIGTYLENIQLPEITEKGGKINWLNRKDNREKALKLISN
ncbi:MmcB family DNA repair protein [Desulfitobacterium sp. AusDCA]|uniref:MmcB family DNA repair protein n=1 Tax=Desulfitobacterium sp. AusDCA TaxID=3240383 RepID=UPI003DA703C9